MKPSPGAARDFLLPGVAVALALVPHWIPAVLGAAALTLFLPGRAFLSCLRSAPAPRTFARFTLSCGLSLAITPLALRLAGLALPFRRPMILGVLTLLAVLPLFGRHLIRQDRTFSAGGSIPPAVLVLLILTVALLIPTLAVGPAPGGGETRIKGWDLNNHLAIAEAVAYRGLPPTNPFLSSASPLYYHAFFHILLGAIQALAGWGAPSYFLIATLAVALAALCLATLYCVIAVLTGKPRLALLSLPFVSLVGGYNLIPVLFKAVRAGELGSLADLVSRRWNVDAWVSHQKFFIPDFMTQFYWAPHAVAGAIALLLALLFLGKEETGWGGIAAAGICLASMAGFNGYIAMGGAATVALLRSAGMLGFISPGMRYRRTSLTRSALAGSTALLLGAPVLSLYFGERGDVDKFRLLHGGAWLPIQVFLEFGPALILGGAGMGLAWRHRERRKGTLAFLLMGAAGLPLICVVASTGENNDLAMRNSMLVWICLACFGGLALDAIWDRKAPRRAAMAILLPGLLGVLWFVIGAAVGKPVLPGDEVAAGRWVRSHLPPGTLIQGSPLRGNPDLVYLSGHPEVLSDTWAARLFYSSPADFDRNLADLRETFTTDDPAIACARLRGMDIAALVAGPPEAAQFPLLARPIPWPCLSLEFEQGSYRVLRLRP
ncbi:MAG: hypothetical protein L0170_08580 [Acidobacteria bacterium]|nr:hypothetical protein [Acidobacteriota bacterium]